MFLVHRAADAQANHHVERGFGHYLKLQQRLLGSELASAQFQVGPLVVRVGLGDGMDDPIHVTDDRAELLILGRPSVLRSSGQSLAEAANSCLLQLNPVEHTVQTLQGDFVVIHANRETGEWSVRSDGMGMGRLFKYDVGAELILSDSVFAIASCVRLELDPTYACMLDISDLIWGNKTLYQGVQAIEVGESVVGHGESSRISQEWQFAHSAGPEPSVEDVVSAYGDALVPRMANRAHVHHCMTGGVDSRTLLGLTMYHGITPSIFFTRTIEADCEVAYHAANELELDCYTTVKPNYIGPGATFTGSHLAEMFLTEGHTRGVFGVRDYKRVVGPNETISLGSYSEGLLRSCWGVAYYGMSRTSVSRIIDRLLEFGAIRYLRLRDAFSEELQNDALSYIRGTLESQTKIYTSDDPCKQTHYYFLRNRCGRFHGQVAYAFNRVSRSEIPASFLSGACEAWKLSSHAYSELSLCRQILAQCEPRLSTFPFCCGSPAKTDLNVWDRGRMFSNRVLTKAYKVLKAKFMGRALGTQQSKAWSAKANAGKPYWELAPQWLLDNSQRRTIGLLRPTPESYEEKADWMKRGYLKTISTLEFASRIYDGDFTAA